MIKIKYYLSFTIPKYQTRTHMTFKTALEAFSALDKLKADGITEYSVVKNEELERSN